MVPHTIVSIAIYHCDFLGGLLELSGAKLGATGIASRSEKMLRLVQQSQKPRSHGDLLTSGRVGFE